MRRLLVAPLAVFLQLQTDLDLLLVLLGVMIHALTHRTLEFDEIVLAHNLVN